MFLGCNVMGNKKQHRLMARVIPRIIIATTDKTHCYQAPASIGTRKTSELTTGRREF